MTINLPMKNLPLRLGFLALALALCAWLTMIVIYHFITGTLADERIPVERERLAASVESFPDSARLNARYAQAEMSSIDRDLDKVMRHAQHAVNLSPYNFEYRLLLASAQELKGDRAAAEKTLQRAIQLAPADPDPHWQMANVRLRQGKLAAALPEFKAATTARSTFLPATLDLIWRASGGNVEAVAAVTGDDTRAKLTLANFLIKQTRLNEAVQVFNQIDRNQRLQLEDSSRLISAFIDRGALSVARELWVGLVSNPGDNQKALLWNGSFENDAVKNFTQFDWNLSRSDYAKLSVDSGIAHSGARALKIEFLGKDTTRLDSEIKQLLALESGQKYRLEYYVKTDKFSAPEGLRVVLTDIKSATRIAATEPLASGTADWQRVTLDFTTPPQSVSGLTVTIKRTPKYSYDEPTRGIVWFDDFTVTKL
ncbi:MAG: carbohydrate binding domain-containing protein [Acidobacteria bacterium]|nr:carbohydrate binding domain-containing protein [Acidobacteriota bacterium]